MTDRKKLVVAIERAKEQSEEYGLDRILVSFKAADMILELLKEQEAKKGHWTISEYEYFDCSCCGNSYYTGCDSTEEAKMRLKKGFYFKYCPYCGAEMTGGEVE